MTDRELLELAAKALGYKPYKYVNFGVLVVINEGLPNQRRFAFCPLQDDGDALRLAVKIEMRITIIGDGMCEVSFPDTRDVASIFEHDASGDTGAATRRAIVRAAAEIGKGMKNGGGHD